MKKLLLTILLSLITFSAFAEESEYIDVKKLNPLSFYKPVYIVFGNQQDQVLAQISFKASVFSWYDMGFFFGYSQMMWWRLYDNSAPFRETNYNPEIFWKWRTNKFILDYIQIGLVEHLSNGKDGDTSRSLNRSYIQVQFDYGTPINYGVNFKFDYIWNISGKNADLTDYTGYYDAGIFVKLEKAGTYTDKEKIYVNWHTGKNYYGFDFTKGFVEIGLQVRLLIKEINPNMFIQFRYGYGEEGFVDYNKKDMAVRVGVTID